MQLEIALINDYSDHSIGYINEVTELKFWIVQIDFEAHMTLYKNYVPLLWKSIFQRMFTQKIMRHSCMYKPGPAHP